MTTVSLKDGAKSSKSQHWRRHGLAVVILLSSLAALERAWSSGQVQMHTVTPTPVLSEVPISPNTFPSPPHHKPIAARHLVAASPVKSDQPHVAHCPSLRALYLGQDAPTRVEVAVCDRIENGAVTTLFLRHPSVYQLTLDEVAKRRANPNHMRLAALLNSGCPAGALDALPSSAVGKLANCRDRSRIFGVLAWPTDNTLVQWRSGQHAHSDLQVDGLVTVFKANSIPQCDVWTALQCENPPGGHDSTPTTIELKDGEKASTMLRLKDLLWPGWFRTAKPTFCGKTGAVGPPLTLDNPMPRVHFVRKRRWEHFTLNGSYYYVVHNVSHFRGVYFHGMLEDGAFVDLDYGGTFNRVGNIWPPDVQTFLRLQSTYQIASLGTPTRIKYLTSAYHMEPMDSGFSYHTLGDCLLPMIHALRHRIARNMSTPILFFRPMRTTFGFEPFSCHFGVDACIVGDRKDGGLAELFRFIAGGEENIFFVDAPGKKTAKGAPLHEAADLEQRRQKRAAEYVSILFHIDELFVGAPTNCVLTTTTEMPLIENADAIRLSRTFLDCVATMRTLRDLVVRMVQTTPGDVVEHGKAFDDAEGTRVSCDSKTSHDPSQHRYTSYVFDQHRCHVETEEERLPVVTTDPAIAATGGEMHVVYLARHAAAGRMLMEEKQVMMNLLAHLRSKAGAQGASRRRRLTIVDTRSLRQAMRVVSAATVLILIHGAAMIYLPFLRPNAAVITLDLVRPTVVPLMPTWIHWGEMMPECISAKKTCASQEYDLVRANFALPTPKLQKLLELIDALQEVQQHAIILNF